MNKSEDDRARRLAAALRQNLRRRKAQAREAQEQVGGASAAEPAQQGAPKMPEKKRSSDAERMRLKALTRWENEGGAEPCGPLVPGADTDCAEGEQADGKSAAEPSGDRKEA